MEILLLSLAAFIAQKGFCSLTSLWLPCSRCPTHFFVVLVHFLPVSTSNTLVDRLAKGTPISVYQGRRNVTNIDARFLGANFLCSQRPFLGTFPD